MVNTEKIFEDMLLVSKTETEEQPEEHKARVSRKLKDILDARLSRETESKVRREPAQTEQVNLEEEVKTLPHAIQRNIVASPL